METKTAKIISVQENQRSYDYQGTKYYVHAIKFEGSEFTWNYDSKSEKCEKFRANEVATFEIDVRQNGQFTNYKIKPKQEFKQGAPKDQGIITYLSVFGSCCNYYAQRSSSKEEVFLMAEEAFNRAINKSTLNK